jgi:tetratricopeptide (TPR) repeat protein
MTLRDQAIKTALEGKWKEAINVNKTLLKETPDDTEALNRLALAYMVIGEATKAKTTYQKVFKLDPLNPIALKNLKCLKEKLGKSKDNATDLNIQLSNNFIEETGKTKIIELINVAPAKTIQLLRTGQKVNLCIKRLKIFILDEDDQYIGVLPDDIGKRLTRFIKNGNKYDACIKSADAHKVTIFIKETKRVSKFKDHPSFALVADIGLGLDKKLRALDGDKSESHDEEEDHEDS